MGVFGCQSFFSKKDKSAERWPPTYSQGGSRDHSGISLTWKAFLCPMYVHINSYLNVDIDSLDNLLTGDDV